MTHATATPVSITDVSTRTEASRFLGTYLREHATTLKVLRALPTTQTEFRPHDRSKNARELAFTFVVEETLMLKALRREPVLAGGFPQAPDTFDAVLDAFTSTHDEIVAQLSDPSNANLDGTSTFFTGPKQTGEFANSELLTFLLMDQVHHRGQFSVYVRMAGGKVPSIYGPSADEPWN